MVFKRHTSPLRFEPLSPLPSELLSEFSDSDDGLDEAARAAKRRKIETLGQNYLEGKPLFILSASLKGPLDYGWVNPWERKKEKAKKAAPLPRALSKQNRDRELSRGTSESIVIPESTSKPLKRRTKDPQVRRQGSGFESSLDPESIQEQKSNQFQSKTVKRDRERLETYTSSHSRRTPSSNIFSKPRSVSARVNSIIAAERPPRSVSASHRVSADSSSNNNNSSWLKTDEKRLRPQAYERLTGSSPTPGYRPRSSGKFEQDGTEQNNKRQRVDDSVDNSTNYTPPRISFTPINGQGALSSSSRITDRELRPEEPSYRKSSKSPGGRSRFPKPEKPASAFTGHSSRREKEEVPPLDGKKGYKSHTIAQPPGSLAVVHSTDHLPESHYQRLDKPSSSADKISNSNCKVERHKHSHSQAPRDSKKPQSEGKDGNGNDNSSHTLAFDPTPNGSHDFRDQTFNNATASETIPSAQIVPGYSNFPNPVISLYSTHFSAAHTSTTRHASQIGGYEEQLLTQAAIAAAQKPLQDELETPAKDDKKASQVGKGSKAAVAVAVPGEQIKPPNGQTSNHGQDASTQAMLNAITPFDFSTVKRIKPGSGRRSEVVATDAPDEKKGEKNQRRNRHRNRNRNSDIPHDPSPPSDPRNQTESLSLSPRSKSKSIPRQHHHRHSQTNGWSSINPPPPPSLPPPSLRQYPSNASNASTTNIPIPAPEESPGLDSTILPFNLTASTNATNATNATGTRQQQDGQGHAKGWDSFDLSQAIADAGTFLGSWDFEKVDLERINHINSGSNNNNSTMPRPPQSSSSGPKLQSILRSNMSGQ
ncbi:hypothetical protein EMCG_04592 [[Emmonsia] crescens]|uniref:Uncharacterized protein n=1 Tax=[Emmonsia] crescens TaxID=73230 RepID=A0A0G2IYN7_9EURO|nr:hypothetical protein EMCG_04592 [Emmonsia crescens UAMH 3008]